MILTIDVGNTTTSLQVKNNYQVFSTFFKNKANQDEKHYHNLIKLFFNKHHLAFSNIKQIAICSVVKKISSKITKFLSQQTKAFPYFLTNQNAFNLELNVKNPNKLGSDIIAGSLGALTLEKGNICVVDCGTATTISFLQNSQLDHYFIIPGISIQLYALAQNTDQIPCFHFQKLDHLVPKDTKQATLSGVIKSHCIAINYFVKNLQKIHPNLKIFLTGGWSQRLASYFNFRFNLVANLTHLGLESFLKNINKNK